MKCESRSTSCSTTRPSITFDERDGYDDSLQYPKTRANRKYRSTLIHSAPVTRVSDNNHAILSRSSSSCCSVRILVLIQLMPRVLVRVTKGAREHLGGGGSGGSGGSGNDIIMTTTIIVRCHVATQQAQAQAQTTAADAAAQAHAMQTSTSLISSCTCQAASHSLRIFDSVFIVPCPVSTLPKTIIQPTMHNSSISSIVLKKRTLQFQHGNSRIVTFEIDALPTGGYVGTVRAGQQADTADNTCTTRYLRL